METDNKKNLLLKFISNDNLLMLSCSLFKATVGGGILCLSNNAFHAGIIITIFFLAIGAVQTITSSNMLLKVIYKIDKFNYEDIAFILYGSFMGYLTCILMILNCFGVVISYVTATCDALLPLFDSLLGVGYDLFGVTSEFGHRVIISIIFTIGLLLPMSISGTYNTLRYVSFIGVVAVGLVTISIIYCLVYLGINENIVENPSRILTPVSFMGVINCLSVISFSYCNQIYIPGMYKEQINKNPNILYKASIITNSCIFILYSIISIIGYLVYGSNINSSILINMYPFVGQNNYMIITSFICVAFSVLVAHTLNVFVVRQSILFLFPQSLNKGFLTNTIISSFIVILSCIVAIAIPDMNRIITVCGAISCGVTAYTLPALFHLKIEYPDLGFCSILLKSVDSFQRFINHGLLILVGVLIGTLGTVISLIGIVEYYTNS